MKECLGNEIHLSTAFVRTRWAIQRSEVGALRVARSLRRAVSGVRVQQIGGEGGCRRREREAAMEQNSVTKSAKARSPEICRRDPWF